MSDDVTFDPKRRGLGRGLEALFGDEEDSFPHAGGASEDAGAAAGGARRMVLGIDQLTPGSSQPRRHFTPESLTELADSIARHGVLQPLIVRQKPAGGGYEIIAGERRWRAAQQAQLHEIPVIIKEIDDQQALEIALIENLQREDLNPVEEAMGYRRLMDEFGHTQDMAAKTLGKSRSHVANTLRLLTLPESVLDLMRGGKLSAGHARALITAADPLALAGRIIAEGLSVRDAEKMATGHGGRGGGKKKAAVPKDVDTIALEKEVSNAIGMHVSIDVRKDGKGGRSGAMKIEFKTLDQLDEILHRLSHFPGRMQTG